MHQVNSFNNMVKTFLERVIIIIFKDLKLKILITFVKKKRILNVRY